MRPLLASPEPPIIVMGVAGCGKSAVGRRLAARLDLSFVEGDELHSPENVARMARGEPLTDELRADWLDAVGQAVAAQVAAGRGVVAACSALKRSYRDRLRRLCPDILFFYLRIDPETAKVRVASRTGHFMPASLVDSQFAILEPPGEDEAALTFDATFSVELLVDIAAGHVKAWKYGQRVS